MEAAVASFGIWQIFLFITAILAFLMPFFVLRIRNEAIQTNKKLDEIASLLRSQHDIFYEQNERLEKVGKQQGKPAISIKKEKTENICSECLTKNKLYAEHCKKCDMPL